MLFIDKIMTTMTVHTDFCLFDKIMIIMTVHTDCCLLIRSCLS